MLRFLLFVWWAPFATPLSAQPAIDWQQTLGGGGSEQAFKLAAHADGGGFAIGQTNSTDGDVSMSYGDLDAWVVRLSPTGELMWEVSLGGSGIDAGRDILATDDGGCVVLIETGSTDGMVSDPLGGIDIWIAKLSSNGQLEWESSIGGSNADLSRSIASSTAGGYLIAAQTASPELPGFHPPGSDYYLASISADGELLAQRCYGGSDSENTMAMTTAQDGSTVTCGSTRSGDGDVVGNLAMGIPSIWVLAVDENLNILRQRLLYSSDGSAQASSIVQLFDGQMQLTGSTSSSSGDLVQVYGNRDIWLANLDTSGSLIEATSLGGSEDESSWQTIGNEYGGSYVIGSTRSNDGMITFSNGQQDAWIVSLDTEFGPYWQRTLGGSLDDRFLSGVIFSDGGLVVAGSSRSSDGDLNMNSGQSDFWIVKFKPETVGIAGQASAIDLRVAPNPAHDQLLITWTDAMERITIHDALGKLIHTQQVLQGQVQLELSVASWAAGVYSILLYGEKGAGSHQFIKQ